MTKFFITVRSISNDQFDDDLGAVRYLAVSDGVAPAGMYRKPCRALIWRMSVDNRLLGAPHIHGELLKLGFAVA